MALRLAPGAAEVVLTEIAVEPGVKYRLEFAATAEGPVSAAPPGWEIRLRNARHEVPYGGHLKSAWQQCRAAEWGVYRQRFYTPGDAVTLQLRFVNPGGASTLTVDAVTLERCDEENLLASAETFAGAGDYSGWSETSKAGIVATDGPCVLRVNPGGYALTDPIPVAPGDDRVAGNKPNAAAFFYAADMRRIGVGNWANATFTAPPGCAYARLFFGPGDIESLTVTRVPEVKP
ncbi:MAG TPA: hypothetical protein PLZ36_03625 [Armatimonadota bacterium]|nr:hypothetical protein [Armatimonadota bacterium]HOS42952.1 hypothetical protein [Armatimonadota bacterium]